jgi:hypothetical protein
MADELKRGAEKAVIPEIWRARDEIPLAETLFSLYFFAMERNRLICICAGGATRPRPPSINAALFSILPNVSFFKHKALFS